MPKPSTSARGYDRRWKRLRLVRLRAEPLCRFCAAQGRTVPATVVDHIVPHKGKRELLYSLENTQSLCVTCHQAVKQAEETTGRVRGVDRDGVPIDSQHHWRSE